MEDITKNKKIIIGSAVLILITIAAFFFLRGGGNSADQALLAEMPIDPVEAILGRQLLIDLQKLKSIKLDITVFGDPIFASLKDFSQDIAKQPVGRRDPFAPLSGGASKPSAGR